MKDKKTCFVIMLFGEKLDTDGQIVDFDKIYQFIIRPAVESADIDCMRCDEISEAGWIHADMFERILEADVAVVDITSLNANVFYELGIRHALVDSVTVLIRKKGTYAPFNIQGLRVIDYDPLDLASVDKAKNLITSFIQNGLKHRVRDSPVQQVLENRIRVETRAEPILKTDVYAYAFSERLDKSICLITGDIQDVRCVDVWVNSENANMQMDRYYDRSISSIIRYLGAEKDEAGFITRDIISDELADKMQGRESVPPGHIVVTFSGQLSVTHNAHKIFHAASVIGAVGQGYKSIQRVDRCITNALSQMDQLEDDNLHTILFPLMGTGKGKGELRNNASLLLGAAVSYLETNPKSKVNKIYFLTYTKEELDVCSNLLKHKYQLVLQS